MVHINIPNIIDVIAGLLGTDTVGKSVVEIVVSEVEENCKASKVKEKCWGAKVSS